MIPPKRFDIPPPLTGGCSEGLGAFRFPQTRIMSKISTMVVLSARVSILNPNPMHLPLPPGVLYLNQNVLLLISYNIITFLVSYTISPYCCMVRWLYYRISLLLYPIQLCTTLFWVGFGCGMYYNVFVCFFLCPCMAINVSEQYNGGLLPTLYC